MGALNQKTLETNKRKNAADQHFNRKKLIGELQKEEKGVGLMANTLRLSIKYFHRNIETTKSHCDIRHRNVL